VSALLSEWSALLRKNGPKRGLALPAVGRLKDYTSFGRLALIAGAVFGLAWISLVVPRGLERTAPIWLSNALMLAVCGFRRGPPGRN